MTTRILQVFLAALAIAAAVATAPAQAGEVLSFNGPSGGGGGRQFSDPQIGGYEVSEVRIRSGAYIDSVEVIYRTPAGQRVSGGRHGGGGGSLRTLVLAPNETIRTVSGKFGKFVDSLAIRTSTGREMRWGGPGGSVVYTYTAAPGSRLYGFWGRAGAYVDALGVIFKTTTP